MGERARPAAGTDPKYATLLGQLKAAEDLVRSRDQALAREQDAHAERIRAIDAKIAGLEGDLAKTLAQARSTAEELAGAQANLQRAEAKLKRAEIEIRNAGGPRDVKAGGG
jgi:chromosome segregation ATPase